MLDGLLGGFTQGITNYVDQERQRQRDREDLAIKQQMDLLKQLLQDPRTTPAMLGKALQDYTEMAQSNASGRKPKKGVKGFWGESETPMSDLLTHLASGSINPMMLNTPSGQAALQGMMQAGVPPKTIDAHTPLGIHAQNNGMGFGPPGAPGSVPPAPIQPPPQATLPPPNPNQAQDGQVGATPAAPPAGPSGPAPNPPGTSQMAQAAGPLADDLNQNGPAITPPPSKGMPSDEDLMRTIFRPYTAADFGHVHDPREDEALFYNPEHMNAEAARQAGNLEVAKKQADFTAELRALVAAGVPVAEARRALLMKLGGAPGYQRKEFLMPDGTRVTGIASSKMPGQWVNAETNEPIPSDAKPFSPSMYTTVDNPEGGKSERVKGSSQPPVPIPNSNKPFAVETARARLNAILSGITDRNIRTQLAQQAQNGGSYKDARSLAVRIVQANPFATEQDIEALTQDLLTLSKTGGGAGNQGATVPPPPAAGAASTTASPASTKSKTPVAPGGAATPPGAPRVGDYVGGTPPPTQAGGRYTGPVGRIPAMILQRITSAPAVESHIRDIRTELAEADRRGLLGPLQGRWNDFMAGKVGSTGNAQDDYLLTRLKADLSNIKTGFAMVHGGARGGGSPQLAARWDAILNSQHMSKDDLLGALDSIDQWLKTYAHDPRSLMAESGLTGNESNESGGVKYQRNKTTGEIRMSTDGGRTWVPYRQQ